MQKYLQCMKIFMFFSLVLFLFVVAHVEDSKPLLRPFWYRFFSITMFGVLLWWVWLEVWLGRDGTNAIGKDSFSISIAVPLPLSQY